MRKRHHGLTLKWYTQIFAYCYPVSAFFLGHQNCQTSDIGRNCDLADEARGSTFRAAARPVVTAQTVGLKG